MSSTMSYAPPRAAYSHYASPDATFDEWSRQLSQVARRPSRSSNGPRPGNAMRIVKPGSTSSSPRSSILQARRRTLVNDTSLSRKRQHIIDQAALPMPAPGLSPEPSKRSQRPMSWHPGSSHIQPYELHGQPHPQLQPPQQSTPANAHHLSAQGRWNDQTLVPNYQHMSPMPASYSCQTSPVTFSPLSLPSNDAHSQPPFYINSQGWNLPHQQAPSYVSPPVDSCSMSPALESNVDYTESFPPLFPVANATTAEPNAGADNTQRVAISEWRSFVEHGFDGPFPPTPENLPQMQLQPAVQSEESAPYEPLPEPEDDSEVLVGMGLYDTPDKHEADPGLYNYRSTVSSLLGGAPRLPEGGGKGLKLEETWQPPESDDEDDEDDEKENQDSEDA